MRSCQSVFVLAMLRLSWESKRECQLTPVNIDSIHSCNGVKMLLENGYKRVSDGSRYF
jgi:hypothetical protein